MHGFVNFIKPKGVSSNFALQSAKKKLNIKKAGHLGTLDPMAEGVLVLGINRGTKFSSFFLDGDKTYRAGITLGSSTDTDDAMGEIIQTSDIKKDKGEVEAKLVQFIGNSMQNPPYYSALKHKGKPLYKYAREGVLVSKPPREINIYSIKNINVHNNICVCDIHCSKGTYIRSIARDLGERLGTGAHLSSLVRLSQGVFNLDDACSLDELNHESIISIEGAFLNFDKLSLTQDETRLFLNGVRFDFEGQESTLFRIYDNDKKFLGLGEVLDSKLQLKRLV
jgi:tRNA pseudouridine55 synthase